ncbi:MAG: AAA family ATPase [Pirellulales bacterium]|nr:AAA family ATPase [Pirellulales bacterium]
MRFDALRLLAFGPFTQLGIDLSAGNQGLHVIYGPNEAGKTSSLRALHGLLYGIPERSSDDFLHLSKELRIGGSLRGSGGQRLDVVRRKARKNSLRDGSDDAVIEEQALTRLLGGVDQKLFGMLFALDHATLVAGGKEILQGRGQVGELLFAAGAGIAPLRRLQFDLQAQADELFKRSAVKPRINATLAEYNSTRLMLKRAQLSVEEWRRQDQQCKNAQTRRQELNAQLAEARTELARLDRLHKAGYAVSRWRELVDQRERLGEGPWLAVDFGSRRERAQADLRNAQQTVRAAEEALTRLSAEHEALPVATPLVQEHDLVDELRERLGSHRKAMRDRPALHDEVKQANELIRELLHRLGRDDEPDDGFAVGVPEHVRLGITQLSEKLIRTREQSVVIERDCRRLRGEIARIESECDAVTSEGSLQPWRAELRRLRPLAEEEAALGELQAKSRRLQREAETRLQALGLWQGELEAVQALPVPPEESIERFDAQRRDLDARCESQQRHLTELNQEIDQLQATLGQLEAAGAVPSASDLAAARALRDRGWRLVMAAWQGGGPGAPEQGEFLAACSRDNLPDAYAQCVQAADELADRLRREADRVADKARLSGQLDRARRRAADADMALQQTCEACARWQNQWVQLWEPLALAPLPPGEMRAWLRRQRELAELVGQWQQTVEDIRDRSEELARQRISVGRIATELGLSPAAADVSLVALVEAASDRAEALHDAARRRADRRAQLPAMRKELHDLEHQQGKLSDVLQELGRDWAQFMRPLGLAEHATAEQAASVLETLAQIAEQRARRHQFAVRVAGIDAEARQFAADVIAAAERLAPDLGDQEPERIVLQLAERFAQSHRADVQRKSLAERLADERSRLERARVAFRQAESMLAQLCEEAGCEEIAQLAKLEQQSTERREVQNALGEAQRQLSELAAGRSLTEFVDDVVQQADELPTRIETLQSGIAQLEEQRDAALRAATEAETELKRMSGGEGAIGLAERCESLLARLRGDAERLAVLRLAQAVLREGVDRYRRENASAVLDRASTLFTQLTCGSFAGLRTEIDEDEEVIVGVRPDGTWLTVEGMSEGTADQLFLALRLASVRAWAEEHEPIPLALDDILVNFDDRRSAAALLALAELSDHVQVVFFTHHAHLVELARQHVAPERVFVHELRR